MEISAQFNAFVNFANRCTDENSIARLGTRIGSIEVGFVNCIDVNENDVAGIRGHISRTRTDRESNDEVRRLFAKTIANMFHGERNIPESVLTAMKLDDFGEGKPLTARRIRLVEAEIEKVVTSQKSLVDHIVGMIGDLVDPEELGPRGGVRFDLDLIIGSHGLERNGDMVSLLGNANVVKGLVLDGKGQAVGLNEMSSRVAGLKMNAEELRKAAKGDKTLFEAGMKYLEGLAGKSLPRGAITALIGSVRGASLGAVNGLSGKSSASSLDKADAQFEKAVEDAGRLFWQYEKDDAPESTVCDRASLNDFVARMVLAHASADGADRILGRDKTTALAQDLVRGNIAMHTAQDRAAMRWMARDNLAALEGVADDAPVSFLVAFAGVFKGEVGTGLTAAQLRAKLSFAVAMLSDEPPSDMSPLLAEAKDMPSMRGIYQNENPQRVDRLVSTALKAAGEDAELREIVMASLNKTICTFGGLRNEAAIRDKVAAFGANLAELRAAEATHPGILGDGIKLLLRIGKPVGPGVFKAFEKAATAQPSDAMRGLNAKSSGLAIHKAIAQYDAMLKKAFVQSGRGIEFSGGDEILPCRDFLTARFVAQLPPAEREGLRLALQSSNGMNLRAEYIHFDVAEDHPGCDIPRWMRSSFERAASGCLDSMNMLFSVVNEKCGLPESVLPKNPPRARLSSFGATGLWAEMSRKVDDNIEFEKQRILAGHVKGSGKAADRLRGLLAETLGDKPVDPDTLLFERLKTGTQISLQRFILNDMKNVALGKTPQFVKALGGVDITLKGVGKVSKDPSVALDQFAQFITGGRRATYAELSPKERVRAQFAMSVASHNVANALASGIGTVFDPEGRSEKFVPAGGAATRTIKMELNRFGRFLAHYESSQRSPGMAIGDEFVPCETGVTVRSQCDITVSDADMARIESIDFTKYDDGPIARILDRDRPEGKFREATMAMPDEFKFDLRCGPEFAVEF
jgi:hypothetical protein